MDDYLYHLVCSLVDDGGKRVSDEGGKEGEAMSKQETGQSDSTNDVVSLWDVVKFKVELHKIANEEEDDFERFTHPLDDAIAKKAYYRHDAIRQCLTLLDEMVLRKAFGQSLKAQVSRPAEAE